MNVKFVQNGTLGLNFNENFSHSKLFKSLQVLILRRNHNDTGGKSKKPFDGDEVLVSQYPYASKVTATSSLPAFSSKLISHLERLSLVRFDSEQAVANIRKAVETANRIESVDTENVEPMYTVWENQHCPVFEDVEEPPLPIEEVFRNSAVSYDDYFVTPPGNVALESAERFDLSMINEWDKIGKPVAPDVRTTKLLFKKSDS